MEPAEAQSMTSLVCSTAINVLSLSIAGVLGVLTRLSIGHLFGPRGASITASDTALFIDLPANFVGCFVIGTFNAWKSKAIFSATLSLAVTTGYAGSVTSFASWNYQVTRMFANGDWVAALFALVAGVCFSSCALILGLDFGNATITLIRRTNLGCQQGNNSKDDNESKRRDSGSFLFFTNDAAAWRRGLAVGSLLLAFLVLMVGCLTGAVIDKGNTTRRLHWASAMFGPIGVVVRWRLSRLNTCVPSFPIGTFLANICAVLLDAAIGAALLVQTEASEDTKLFLNALISGFAGALSTVSTWVVEIFALGTGQKYVYMILSIACAQGIGLLVYGTTFWAVS